MSILESTSGGAAAARPARICLTGDIHQIEAGEVMP
jgi:hypothetical protein